LGRYPVSLLLFLLGTSCFQVQHHPCLLAVVDEEEQTCHQDFCAELVHTCPCFFSYLSVWRFGVATKEVEKARIITQREGLAVEVCCCAMQMIRLGYLWYRWVTKDNYGVGLWKEEQKELRRSAGFIQHFSANVNSD
jgi:hypothetical protein